MIIMRCNKCKKELPAQQRDYMKVIVYKAGSSQEVYPPLENDHLCFECAEQLCVEYGLMTPEQKS